MSHSVVKVTESVEDDRLLLLVGEDGSVTPDKDTVDEYLKAREGPTNVQIMHMTKAEGRTIELSVENLTYIHGNDDVEEEEEKAEVRFEDMDEVARNLFTFRLDHDYTPLTSPKQSPIREPDPEPVDELAETLSLLDGGESVTVPPPKTVVKSVTKAPAIKKSAITPQQEQKTEVKPQQKPKQSKTKAKEVEEEDEEDEDFDEEFDDNDDNDSDFELEEPKQRPSRRSQRTRSKSTTETKKQTNKSPVKAAVTKPKTPAKQVVEEKPQEKPPPPPPPPPPVEPPTEKKQVKKEKKPPKPIPDDFALFSTPDIIRRVGGKEQATPSSPEAPTKPPAKISPENRSKSNSESRNSISKPPATRLSVDSKAAPEKTNKAPITYSVRRVSADKGKLASKPANEPKATVEETQPQNLNETTPLIDLVPSNTTENVPTDVLNENALPDDVNMDQNNIGLETAGLELDQSILDNINSDMISDDILYQVAKQLVDNSTDLQNVLDKSLADGNLVLDPALMSGTQEDHTMQNQIEDQQPQQETSYETPPPAQKGTQIVRPDGRIVVIPPIERPTTRSRNKKETEKPKVVTKPLRKPLDDQHVSGNELDSSEGEEDKSEDDPDKLWCICNQPHNNRFMICCDTCEEWYHGKCVNVTKAMGQMMEQEGRDWICVYCKDPSLKRPKAAARRIRKASKASNDSSGSAKKSEQPQRQNSALACIVCSKPSRKNSIYCSEACILKHAQGVERVVVFDRASGKILSGNKAPSAANIEKWLKEHPTYEVVRSTSKNIPNNKLTQSKLKLVKNTTNDGVSLAVQKKGVNVGVLQHAPKSQQQPTDKKQQQVKQVAAQPTKVISKKVPLQQSPQQQQKVRILNSELTMKSQHTPTKPKTTVQTTLKVTSVEKREKERPTVQRTSKPKQQEQSSQQPKPQENIRENVYKTLSEQLMNRLKEAKDLTLSEEEVDNISTEIESQLFKCFGDTGQKYKNKYRSLIFNIKDAKNQTLWRRICEKSISPYQLVRLSPDDLASQELALWREREAKHQLDMIKKSELELLNCNRQYVFKTHKGEQVLEDDRPNDSIDSTEVIANLGADSTSLDSSESKQESKDKDKKSVKHGKRDKEKDQKSNRDRSDRDHKKRHRSSSKDRDKRKRSRSRDRSSRRSERKSSRSRDRHRHTSHKSSRHKKDNTIVATDKLDKRSKEILEQLVDKQIVPPLEDQLWDHVPQDDVVPVTNMESDSDHEPSSTVTIPTPPRTSEAEEPAIVSAKGSDKGSDSDVGVGKDVIRGGSPPKLPPEFVWKGTVSMVDVAQISITAHEVSGDCNGLGVELPANLEIVGRISPETVWDYIGKMKCSNSKTISLLRLTATNVEERMPYIALYSYLSSRNRLGVVKSTNKAVKDFYILPLAVQKPIPQALLPINGPGFEESRPPLLLGIIVRDKRKRALLMDTSHPVTKKVRVEIDIPPEPPVVTPAVPARSYTPPPTRDPRVKQPYNVETPPAVPAEEAPADDMDEPYSPEDSDPDTVIPPVDPTSAPVNTEEIPPITAAIKASSFLDTSLSNPTQTFEPFSNKFDAIPGLEDAALPSSSQELQKKMEELDQRIAMQKAEIDTMSQDIVSTASASSDIGTTALASISLPSNLQQILDNIKTIGSTVSTDSQDSQGSGSDNASASGVASTAELTIPLMLPKIGSRPAPKPSEPPPIPISTIPLNIPTKPKRRINTTPPPINLEPEKNVSVLSSLTEEDLIRKAEEMLGEPSSRKEKDDVSGNSTPPPAPQLSFSQPPLSLNAKKPKLDLPPVPGLEDDT